jgi:polysaccharide biosynthesis transport protein
MAYEIALPDDQSNTFQDYLDALRRRQGTAIKIAAAILVVGLAIIFFLPNSYQSTATILIEDPEVPRELAPSTVTTFAARQIQYINQRVMTRTNLAQIIEKFNLYPDERKYLPTLLLVDEVEAQMSIDLVDVKLADPSSGQAGVSSTIAFTLGFEHETPAVARQVANELVSLYLAENVRSRTEQTAETSSFMQAEVDKLDGDVKEIDAQIAKLKRENEGALPEQTMMNLQFMQRADQDLLEIDRELRGIEETKIIIDAQLASLEPMAPMSTADGRAVAPPADQLRALQSELTMLEARYSPDHPDVLRARRNVEALRAEVGEDLQPNDLVSRLTEMRARLSKASEQYGPEHPEVLGLTRQVAALESEVRDAALRPRTARRTTSEPNNPVYLQVLAQRKQLDAKIGSLEVQRSQIRAKIADYERKFGQTTDVERELNSLLRKRDAAAENYQRVRDRLFAAQMGQSLETQSKGERFTLVEPPDLPLVPSSPNRPILLTMLILLVLAAGFGWPQVAESMDGSINSARAVERVQGSPPLAEIPLIQNNTDIVQKRKIRLSVLVIAPLVLAAAALAVHFFVANLDVLWYVIMRRMGM